MLNIIMKKILLIFLVVLFLTFLPNVFANNFTCVGGITNTGISLNNEGWQNGNLFKCNSIFDLTPVFSNEKVDDPNFPNLYYSMYTLVNVGLTKFNAQGQQNHALTIPVRLPEKYQNPECKLQRVYFRARAEHAIGIARGHNYSNLNNYLNSLISNYSTSDDRSNCISKTHLNIGKHGMLNLARYEGWFAKHPLRPTFCTAWDLRNDYLNSRNFSVALHSVESGGIFHGFNPQFYFYYERETDAQICSRLGKNCGTLTTTDTCGNSRTVNCGSTPSGQICTNNVLGCQKQTWYLDADGDGYYPSGGRVESCERPSGVGWTTTPKLPGDCDDGDSSVNPGRTQICSGKDDNCSGVVDKGFECVKGSPNCNNLCQFESRNNSVCLGSIPQNAELNYSNNRFTQTWNGSSWTPSSKNYFHSLTQSECAWRCSSGFIYNSSTNSCMSNLVERSCIGDLPNNAFWDDSGQNGKYSYSFGQSDPQKQVQHGGSNVDCRFRCSDGFSYENGVCVMKFETKDCVGGLPANALWDDDGRKGTYTFQTGQNDPNKSAQFGGETDCRIKCRQGFIYMNGQCTSINREATCDLGDIGGQLEDPFVWNDGGRGGKFTQTWDGFVFSPKNIDASFNIFSGNCNYYCENDYQYCELDEKTYCGPGRSFCEETGYSSCEPYFGSTTCGEFEQCNRETNNCEACEDGKASCDGDLTTGCETNIFDNEKNCGACGITCNVDEVCRNGQCLNPDIIQMIEETHPITFPGVVDEDLDETDSDYLRACYFNSDCREDEFCENNFCKELVCENGFIPSNHSCACAGSICGDTCYASEGICCNNVWNQKINSCNISILTEENIVMNSSDLTAMSLIDDAKKNIGDGNVLVGKTMAMLAASKIQNQELYQEANFYFQNEDYLGAYNLLIEQSSPLSETTNDENPFLIVIILIIGIILVYLGYKKFKSSDFEEEF